MPLGWEVGWVAEPVGTTYPVASRYTDYAISATSFPGTEVKNYWAIYSSPYVLMGWCWTKSREIFIFFNHVSPITVAARSKVSTIFARSNIAVVGSNPTRVIDVCVRLFCVRVLCIGIGPAMGLSPVQGVLPTLYRLKKLKTRHMPKKGL
jgi:hypothetical protein